MFAHSITAAPLVACSHNFGGHWNTASSEGEKSVKFEADCFRMRECGLNVYFTAILRHDIKAINWGEPERAPCSAFNGGNFC